MNSESAFDTLVAGVVPQQSEEDPEPPAPSAAATRKVGKVTIHNLVHEILMPWIMKIKPRRLPEVRHSREKAR